MQPQACRCTPNTPVTRLCPDCLDKRRRIRDRLNRRKARAKERGREPRPTGMAVLPPDTVADLADAVAYLTQLLNEIGAAGQPLTPLEQQLVYSVRLVCDTLRSPLRHPHDELVEMQRPTTQYPTEYRPADPKFAWPRT